MIVVLMITGIVFGYLFRNNMKLKKTENTISLTILVLLFLFGVSIGGDKLIVCNLGYFGWQAGVLAFLGLLGSILASWLVGYFYFKKGGTR